MTDIDPTELTVTELEAEVEAVDDPDAIGEIIEAETAGDDRVTARDVLQERLAEITDDDADDDDEDVDGGEVDGQDGTTRIYVRNLDKQRKKAAGHWFESGETKLVKKTPQVEQALKRGQLQYVA